MAKWLFDYNDEKIKTEKGMVDIHGSSSFFSYYPDYLESFDKI